MIPQINARLVDVGAMTRPVRLAIVIDHPAQQFTRALQLLAQEAGIQVHVYYGSVERSIYNPDFGLSVSWDVDLLEGYEWMAPESGRRKTDRMLWLVARLLATRPDVIVCYGWASPSARVSIVYSVLSRTRLLMYGDSTWQHSPQGGLRSLKSSALRVLMRVCAGAVSTGTFNREFYIRYGMNPKRIWPGVCPADTEYFRAAGAETRPAPRSAGHLLRIGFAGKLIPRKGAEDLIRAVALLAPTDDWSLTLVGDGPLMVELQDLAVRLGVAEKVEFHGFANTSEMPKLLAAFDVVVVPSRLDMRVLVTIEAMAAGAAIVVSDATAVWGPGDLVEDGVTGLVYPSGDHTALASALSRLLTDQALLGRIRCGGAERALEFGPDSFARTVASAARACCSPEKRRGFRGGRGL
jgi:glycosyltransferase involved in cell wall biosynthesis